MGRRPAQPPRRLGRAGRVGDGSPGLDRRALRSRLRAEGQVKGDSVLIKAALVGFILVGSAASAQEVVGLAEQLTACAALASDPERLSCFDAVAARLPIPPAPDDVGAWIVETMVNPIDDTPTILLSLPATAALSRFGKPITLGVRCQSGVTEAYVLWHDFLGTDAPAFEGRWKNVTTRLGDDQALTARWPTSVDELFTLMPEPVIDTLRRMAGEARFVAQTAPLNAAPVTAEFDLTGMAAALRPLMEACGWTLSG